MGQPTTDEVTAEVQLDLAYKPGGMSFTSLIGTLGGQNERDLQLVLGDELGLASQVLDDLYGLASHYIPWIVRFPGTAIHPATRVLLTSFHKGLINLGCALSLSRQGFYGPARPLMRQSFEAAVIGKFCAVSSGTNLHDRWSDGRDVLLARHIFDKIKLPSPAPMKGFWQELSRLTHATIYAAQVSLVVRDEEGLRAVSFNLGFVSMIAECLYHLLISHLVTNSARHYQQFYGDKEDARSLASNVKSNLKEMKRRLLTSEAVKVTSNYRAKWVTN